MMHIDGVTTGGAIQGFKVNCTHTTSSNILDSTLRSEIGLWFDGFVRSPDFGIGTTLVVFQHSGKTPVLMGRFTIGNG